MKSLSHFSKPGNLIKNLNYGNEKLFFSPLDNGIFHTTTYNPYINNKKYNKNKIPSIFRDEKSTPLNKLTNLLMKSGKKYSSYLSLIKVFKELIFVVKFEEGASLLKYMSAKYPLFNSFRDANITSPLSANFMLSNLIESSCPIFTLKADKVPKRLKRKLKARYRLKHAYVPLASRRPIALKWVASGLHWFSGGSKGERLSKLILNLLFKGDKSYISQKKMKIYKRVIKAYKDNR